MKNKFTKGFTLIELLMVVAIIGILVSIVIVALNQARQKGNDAGVKSNLVSIRSKFDIYYGDNSNSYGNFAVNTCPITPQAGSVFSDPVIINAINAALASGGNGTRCVASGSAYAVAVGLKTAGQSWCIDSLNKSKQFAGTPTAAITNSACN